MKHIILKKIWVAALALALIPQTGCSGQNVPSTNETAMANRQALKENKNKNYSIIFLNITDEAGYNKYRKATEKLRKKYGGHVEREFDVLGQKGNISDFEAPNRAIVMYWDTPEASKAIMEDKKYQKAFETLKASTSSIRAVHGTSAMYQSSNSDESGRMWLMKISYYKEKTPGRLDMLKELGQELSPYGFYTERMVMANGASGMATPSEVTVHFHDFAHQNEELQKNQKIIDAIGEYNQKFLNHFVYLPLKLH